MSPRILKTGLAALALSVALLPASRAEFLFAPENPTEIIGFFTPTMSYYDDDDAGLWYQYAAWDIMYSPRPDVGNYPDVYAPAGGTLGDPSKGQDPTKWYPEERPNGEPWSPHYNPGPNPLAFWDPYNPTIRQTLSNTTFIIGPDATGNIYTYQDKTAYQLHDNPDYADRGVEGAGLNSVIFQFQTDGTNVDFANIVLKYKGTDGNTHSLGVNDRETEYLREYAATDSEHWSATAGYRNRTLLQWDLSGVETTGEYWIEWGSLSSSMSFQMAELYSASYYEAGMPTSSTLRSGGAWSDYEIWQSGATPVENGNLKFANTGHVTLDLDDSSHTVGEIILDQPYDVTITSSGNHRLKANTGITIRNGAPDAAARVYTFDLDYELGALNFFEVNNGTLVMNGDVSGNYGIVKSGSGSLVFNGENSFTKFLAIQGGDVRINGTNEYTGTTNILNGRLFITSAGALGNGSLPLTLGGNEDLYLFVAGSSAWMGELILDGDFTINRGITLGTGDLGKRIGAINTTTGATIAGNIAFTGSASDPDDENPNRAVGNTRLTAFTEEDRLIFTGQMTGGNSSKTLTLDGLGTVVYSGANKTYATATRVASGTLLIDEGTTLVGSGGVTVEAGARLDVQGTLSGEAALTVRGGRLNVDGQINQGAALLTLEEGARLTGGGAVYREFVLEDGATLAPGNSIGTIHTGTHTWGGGGVYEWEISSALGTAGQEWDLVEVTGELNLTATSADRFELRLTSLNFLADFDETQEYSWLIASADGGINGFDLETFFLNTDDFANPYLGDFQLFLNDTETELYLRYTAVPEPGTWALLGSALLLAAARRLRRTRPTQA